MQAFSVVMIQLIVEILYTKGVITGVEQEKMYLDAITMLQEYGDSDATKKAVDLLQHMLRDLAAHE